MSKIISVYDPVTWDHLEFKPLTWKKDRDVSLYENYLFNIHAIIQKDYRDLYGKIHKYYAEVSFTGCGRGRGFKDIDTAKEWVHKIITSKVKYYFLRKRK